MHKLVYNLNSKSIIPKELGCLVIKQEDDYDVFSGNIEKLAINEINKFYNGEENKCNIYYTNTLYENYIRLWDLESFKFKSTVYHFFRIKCTKFTESVFSLRIFKRHKIWINSNLFCITNPREQFLLVKLKRGVNDIIIETPWAKKEDSFFIRISSYEFEKSAGKFSLFNECLIQPEDIKLLYCTTNFMYNKESFVFGLYPNDNINVDWDQNVKLELFDVQAEKLYLNTTIKFAQKITIPLASYSYEHSSNLNSLRLKITYKTKKDIECIVRKELYLYDIGFAQHKLIQKAVSIALNDKCRTYYDSLCINFKLEQLNSVGSNLVKTADILQSLYSNIQLIENGKHLDESIYAPLSKRVFFKSKLDEKIKAYHAYVPKDYDPQKAYPLLIHFSTPELTNYSQYYKAYTNEKVISVDISQRGFTLGSYIGEAAIIEALLDIRQRFNIDKERVYLLGHSNGASAVFSIAQSYPHYFAGALTISGVCYIDGLCNLKNMKIINVSSKTEANFKLGYERLHKKFLQFKNCTEVLIDNSNHNTMVFMLSSGKIISELIKSKLNPYPDNIEYFTLRNNHRTAYWVKLDKIPLGKQYSKIIARIIENVIDVKLINSNGVTITIPPQIDKRKFCIKINGKIFEFVSYKKSSITFKKIKNQFAITNEEFDYVDIVKGNGLLTVFFNSLKIITGSNDDEIIKTAKSFAQPKTNATNPDIYVKYPISSNIDDIKTIKSNYIIIESNSSDKELIKIKEKLPVKTYKYGYKYKNRKYYGDYCIMQIIPSPYFDGNYILYVNSNNNDMFDKNVFTRRFTIPTYSKGYHKFLNNIVLIYNEQGYHKIIESGDDIVKIT